MYWTFLFRSFDEPGSQPEHQIGMSTGKAGAPTLSLWVPLGILYTLLMALLGFGVWKSANENRAMKVVGIVKLLSASKNHEHVISGSSS